MLKTLLMKKQKREENKKKVKMTVVYIFNYSCQNINIIQYKLSAMRYNVDMVPENIQRYGYIF